MLQAIFDRLDFKLLHTRDNQAVSTFSVFFYCYASTPIATQERVFVGQFVTKPSSQSDIVDYSFLRAALKKINEIYQYLTERKDRPHRRRGRPRSSAVIRS